MIAIVYESNEWSNQYLRDYLEDRNCPVMYVDFENYPAGNSRLIGDFAQVGLVVNRLFPSSFYRGHPNTYNRGTKFLADLDSLGIPMVNSFASHVLDFDKRLTGRKLTEAGISNPEIHYCGTDLRHVCGHLAERIKYPCVVKPNCGGRTSYTYIVKDSRHLADTAAKLPDIEFIVQEYVRPVQQCIHRVEIFSPGEEQETITAFKRSIDEEGLSAYSRGAIYEKILSPAELDGFVPLCRRLSLLLDLKMASFDLIASETGEFKVIDVNSTANYAEPDINTFGYNPVAKMGEVIIREYEKIKSR